MKAYRLTLAAAAVLAVAALTIAFVPEAQAAVAWLAAPHGYADMAQLAIAVPLATLRTNHADLVRRAEAKANEIKEGMPEADVTRITAEHDALVAEAETVQRQITEAETAEAAARANPNPANPVNPQQAAAAAVAAERTRAATIRDIGLRAGMPAADIQTAIDNGDTVEAVRTRAFDLLSQRSVPIASVRGGDLDETETRRAGMSEAIAFRMSQRAQDRVAVIAAPTERARPWAQMGIVEMAAEAIGHRGHLRTADQVDGVMRRAFLSTSDFPGIFGTAMNSRLLARYAAATPAYRLFCARYDAVDFRAMPIIRAGDFPTLQAVPQTGVIPAGSFSESKESLSVTPYGVTFNLSRAMFINDNLGAIEQILGSAGTRVTDWENVQAFASLTASSNLGPALLTDTYHVFDSSHHANYDSSGTAISVTSIGVGRADMMAQTSLDGIKLNLMPATLMTAPGKATIAEQIVTSITPAQSSNAVPDWMKRLQVAADANLSGNGWYLFADVNVAPCWVYGSLQGSQGPRLTTDDPFTIQGLSVKLEHDFGVAAIDYRGAYFNAGA